MGVNHLEPSSLLWLPVTASNTSCSPQLWDPLNPLQYLFCSLIQNWVGSVEDKAKSAMKSVFLPSIGTTFTRRYLWLRTNSHWRGHGESRWFILSEREVQCGEHTSSCPWSNKWDIYISNLWCSPIFSWIMTQSLIKSLLVFHSSRKQDTAANTFFSYKNNPKGSPKHACTWMQTFGNPPRQIPSRILHASQALGNVPSASKQRAEAVLALSSLACQYHLWAELMSKQKVDMELCNINRKTDFEKQIFFGSKKMEHLISSLTLIAKWCLTNTPLKALKSMAIK